ncbi:alpha/beta fold hydrolase [Streptomyces sp. NPDC057474]|uniref:alpha/beta fold hydrolase n=1 Tax=Streptomyces sp. NPDC057474 TaxID=3346144 RepID=UPI0036D08230
MTESVSIQPIDIQGTSDPDFIEVNGVDVAYRRAGAGAPLLFLHGMGMANSWLESHAKLAEHFDVIAAQLPGFGRTARPAWYRTLDDYVPLLADFLNALDIPKAHVVGHSLGGYVAGAFGAVYPERLLSLTLVAPLPMPVVRAPELEGGHDGPVPPNIMAILFNDNEAAYSEYDPPADLGLFVSEADDEFADPSAWKLDAAPGLYRHLSRIKVPTQLVVPDEDRVVPEAVFHDWARWLGDAPIVKISGTKYPTGHMLTAQEPQAFADQIVALAERAST